MKLLIADDEKIIRETISSIIDLASLDIQLIGTASNGIEAYNIILDEYPDIVLTDIKMPGLTGLELIDRIKKINQDTEFIILSGYDEFKYAQEAMRYGVKNYLLKPCNELQIMECLQDTVNSLVKKRSSRQGTPDNTLIRYFESNIILTIISAGIFVDKASLHAFDFSNIYDPYHIYLDFYSEPYELCFLYFVEQRSLSAVTTKIMAFHRSQYSGTVFNIIYVNNTLLFFYKSPGMDTADLDNFMNGLCPQNHTVSFQYERKEFNNLELLLNTILAKIKRYEMVYYSVDGNNFIHICNFKNILQEFDQCILQLKSPDPGTVRNALSYFKQLVEPITDLNLLKQIVSSSIMQLAAFYTPATMMSASDKLYQLNQITNCRKLSRALSRHLEEMIEEHLSNSTALKLSEQVKKIVAEHLEDPNLSLKWIAENYLYMNVDYLSKKFLSETGDKFSGYLTHQRIKRSKLLLKQYNSVDKIKMIAELVGCGNNPQYFSHIFKKETGMSPSCYIKSIQEE